MDFPQDVYSNTSFSWKKKYTADSQGNGFGDFRIGL